MFVILLRLVFASVVLCLFCFGLSGLVLLGFCVDCYYFVVSLCCCFGIMFD